MGAAQIGIGAFREGEGGSVCPGGREGHFGLKGDEPAALEHFVGIAGSVPDRIADGLGSVVVIGVGPVCELRKCTGGFRIKIYPEAVAGGQSVAGHVFQDIRAVLIRVMDLRGFDGCFRVLPILAEPVFQGLMQGSFRGFRLGRGRRKGCCGCEYDKDEQGG